MAMLPFDYVHIYALSCLTHVLAPIQMSVLHIFLSLFGTGEQNCFLPKNAVYLTFWLGHSARVSFVRFVCFLVRLLAPTLTPKWLVCVSVCVCRKIYLPKNGTCIRFVSNKLICNVCSISFCHSNMCVTVVLYSAK